jgi:hypothetical protein
MFGECARKSDYESDLTWVRVNKFWEKQKMVIIESMVSTVEIGEVLFASRWHVLMREARVPRASWRGSRHTVGSKLLPVIRPGKNVGQYLMQSWRRPQYKCQISSETLVWTRLSELAFAVALCTTAT